MEYRALVVGKETGFAAHVTALATFKPVTSGKLTLKLKLAEDGELSSQADASQSPGIFRPVLTPQHAGACRLFVSLESAQVADAFEVGPCEVYADTRAAALGAPEAAQGGRVPFLKEQQWSTEFATQPVAERALQPSVATYGELKPVAGQSQRIRSPISGWLVAGQTPPQPGAQVRAGQLLAVLAPRLPADSDRASLEAALAAARAELLAAEARLKRSEDLLATGAVSQQTLEDARATAQSARVRLETATARLSQYQGGAAGSGGFPLRAPFAGTLAEVRAAPGEFVEPGEHLFTVINQHPLWLEARVYEPDIPLIEKTSSAWFTVAGREPISIAAIRGRLLNVGRALSSESHTISVLFEVPNADGTLRSGQRSRVHLATGPEVRVLALPESAILEDAGRSIAYVQAEGEAFERRVLSIGVRDRGLVEVRAGIQAGERVVTRGAYEIKLSSASGSIPAHGHAH